MGNRPCARCGSAKWFWREENDCSICHNLSGAALAGSHDRRRGDKEVARAVIEAVVAGGGDGDGWIQTPRVDALATELALALGPEWIREDRENVVMFHDDQETISVSAGPPDCVVAEIYVRIP